MMSSEEIELAQTLWDFHKIEEPLAKADLIFGLGSYDLRVAEHCANLFRKKWAPCIAFSGAEGNFTRGKWSKSEAEMFADVAIAAGVDPDKILVEPNATNTGDNVRLTQALLREKGIQVSSIILVSKPNMNRRGLATCEKVWSEVQVTCSHPDTHFLHSPAEGHSSKDVVHEIVGDLQRMIEYPKKGYQAEHEIPEKVLTAYERLIQLGYTGHLL